MPNLVIQTYNDTLYDPGSGNTYHYLYYQSLGNHGDLIISYPYQEGAVTNTGVYPPIYTNIAAARAAIDSVQTSLLLSMVNTQTGASYYTTTSLVLVEPAVQDALNLKFNAPGGGTSQYVRGDGSLASFPSLATVAITGAYSDLSGKPSIPAAQVNSDWNAVSGLAQILNKPTLNTQSQSSATRSLNSAFQPSSTQNAVVIYSVQIATTLSLTTGQSGSCFLEVCASSSFASGVQTITSVTNAQTGTLTLGLGLTQTYSGTVMGFVPAGYYARLRTANNTGTPTFTYMSGQEILV